MVEHFECKNKGCILGCDLTDQEREEVCIKIAQEIQDSIDKKIIDEWLLRQAEQ